MKKTVITLAAALTLGVSWAALAQEQDPALIIPDGAGQQQGQAPDEQPQKKRKKHESEQPAAEQQFEQPQPEKKRKKQVEQPVEQPTDQQAEQPRPEKKRRKQVEQPVEQQAEQPQPEKKRKKQVEQPVEQPTDQQAEQPQPEKKRKKQVEQPVEQPTEKPAAAGVPADVTQYLSDTRPASELTDAELTQRMRTGRSLSKMQGLPDDVRQELASKARQARTEAIAREQGKGGGKAGNQPVPGQEQPPVAEQPAGEQPAGERPAQAGGQGQDILPGEPAVNPDKQEVQKLDGNKASPQAEAKAKDYLDDGRSGDQLKDDELRARVDGMRDLLAGNELSRDTERALRGKLRAERDILRNRVAQKVIVDEKKVDEKDRFPRRRDRDDRRWNDWAERDILRDRRRSDELEEGELRRRIDIYRVAIYDDRYSAEERRYWRDMMERDRRYLGDWMRRDRRERERYWYDRRDRNEINIDINIILGPDRELLPAAFMDEIDDEELEDYLVTAPRRKVARRYTVAEIEEEPEIRTAMPAIEIDNVHFGFNEAFLREEEVESLDRIAEVVEKILAAHPDEVFMIEGHTDAVGSDAYNLKLSRERAQAVKKALTTYYVIPARNLVTVGYGERYLKIPTSEPEEENRRVSFRRVTPLVGEAE